jgi:hypothetical protein
MPDDQMANEDKAPYLSLTTLLNFFDRWGNGPVPPRIDKSALDNYSGGTQAILLSTLRLMGYINHDGMVLPDLRDAIRDEHLRKVTLARWADHFYAEQLDLAQTNATSQMLQESFAKYGYNGSTLRKAIVFYLALVEYLGLPNSPHFRPPKQSATPPSRRRTPRPQAVWSNLMALPETTPASPTPHGETTVIKIGDLATITVTVDAQWLRLPVETISTIRTAVKDLEGLADSGEPD